MTSRRILQLALASAVATGLATAWTGISSASADPSNSVLVSLDGQEWSQSLENLFPQAGFYPGASFTRTVQVRNDSAVDAALEVAAIEAAASTPEFLDMLLLGAHSPSGGGELPLASAAACTKLIESQLVPAGATVPVDLTLRMADVSGDAGKGASAEFAVGISLREAGVPSLDEDCGTAGGNSPDPEVDESSSEGQKDPLAVVRTETSAVSAPAPSAGPDTSGALGEPGSDDGSASMASAPTTEPAEQLDTLGLGDARPQLAPILASTGAAGAAALIALVTLLARRRRSKENP